jgi:hypothetical protein
LGFSRKSDGKRALEKHFIIDIDSQVIKSATANSAKVEMEKSIDVLIVVS